MAGKMNPLALMLMRNGRRDDDRREYQTRDEPWEPERPRRMTYVPPYGEPDMRRRNYPRSEYDGDGVSDRRMGFGEMRYGSEREREPIRFGGMVSMESGEHRGHHKLTREKAESWVEGLKNADPAKPRGGKWTMDQIKPVAQKYGVPTEGERFVEFWAVMNALYSDYYSVAKKHNVLNPDFFADMAMAFISDEDAVENKAAVYYECIVEH